MRFDTKPENSIALCIAKLSLAESKYVRATVLLASARLQHGWRISDFDDEYDCRLVPPTAALSDGIGTVETRQQDGSILLFELEWPLKQNRLIGLLNNIGNHRQTHRQAANQAAAKRPRRWLSNLISGITRRSSAHNDTRNHKPPPTLLPQTHSDKRNDIGLQLTRFGKGNQKQAFNIMFVGSPGSGKTTAIGTISSTPIKTTEVSATDTVAMLKSRTTVALDYGQCELEDCLLRLYGTPGQLRFAHMINNTLASCDAALLLIDATSNDPLGDINQYLPLLEGFGPGRRPLVVAYTHVDEAGVPENFNLRLTETLQRRVIGISLDPRVRSSVRRTLALMANICAMRNVRAKSRYASVA